MSTMENFIISLEIMGKGMGGIFVATILIMIIVWALGKFSASSAEKKDEEENRMP